MYVYNIYIRYIYIRMYVYNTEVLFTPHFLRMSRIRRFNPIYKYPKIVNDPCSVGRTVYAPDQTAPFYRSRAYIKTETYVVTRRTASRSATNYTVRIFSELNAFFFFEFEFEFDSQIYYCNTVTDRVL